MHAPAQGACHGLPYIKSGSVCGNNDCIEVLLTALLWSNEGMLCTCSPGRSPGPVDETHVAVPLFYTHDVPHLIRTQSNQLHV